MFQLFEIGKVFSKNRATSLRSESWQASVGLIDACATDEQLFRALRGIVEGFAGTPIEVTKDQDAYLCTIGKTTVASIQIWRKGEVTGLRFRTSCAALLIDLEKLVAVLGEERVTFKPLPYYPIVERDLGVVAPNVVQYRELGSHIAKFDSLIKKVALFDVYHGLDNGASYAFRLTFSSTDRTLESHEVDEVMEKLKVSLKNAYHVSFR